MTAVAKKIVRAVALQLLFAAGVMLCEIIDHVQGNPPDSEWP